MSTAYFIVLDDKKPGFDTFVNGKSLAKDADRLARITDSLGIRQLGDYVSYSPKEAREMMEAMGTDPGEIDAIELPQVQWFDPQEGLDLVARLTDHIQLTPASVHNPVGVLADLQEFREVLEKAKAVGARWNLHVDF